MTINLMTKTVYGNDRIYPNCEKSKLLASLTRKKTLDKNDIYIIKSLGYEVLLNANTGVKL